MRGPWIPFSMQKTPLEITFKKRFLREVIFFFQHPYAWKRLKIIHWWWSIAIVTPKKSFFWYQDSNANFSIQFPLKKNGEAPNQIGPCKNKKRNSEKKIQTWEDAIFHRWVFSSKISILNPKSRFGRWCSFSLRWCSGSTLISMGQNMDVFCHDHSPPSQWFAEAPWPQLDVGWKSLLWTCKTSP